MPSSTPSSGEYAIGLDPSLTGFGIARVWVEGDLETEVLAFPKLRGMARLIQFRETLSDLFSREHPSIVAVEGYSYGSGNQAHQVGELGGVIRMLLWEAGVPTVIVQPTALKKYVTGRGNAKKDEMRLEAFKRFGIEAKTQDEVEAACLAKMGLTYIGFGQEMPKEHLEAMKKISVLE